MVFLFFPLGHVPSVQGRCCHLQSVQVLPSDIWILVRSPRIIHLSVCNLLFHYRNEQPFYVHSGNLEVLKV